MKLCGIITEYNPFHNGHRYQIQQIKKNYDAIVCVMSGSFVQRGAPACADKWARTRWALENGADLILELPCVFAVNTAERFAFGAVCILNHLGCVDGLCFGSESGDLEALSQAAFYLDHEPPKISRAIKDFLKEGLSYAAARSRAFSGLLTPGVLDTPNNILAVEYLRALNRTKSAIVPFTIQRVKTGYHDLSPRDHIASASAIRNMQKEGIDFSAYTPATAFSIPDTAPLDALFTGNMRRWGALFLKALPDISEGIEQRFEKGAALFSTIDKISDYVKTKRYTKTRIDRIIINALLGNTASLSQQPPAYLRVLGFTKTGAAILKKAKNTAVVPIITKTADYKKKDPVFQQDLLATDLQALCLPDKRGGKDFTLSPIVIQ